MIGSAEQNAVLRELGTAGCGRLTAKAEGFAGFGFDVSWKLAERDLPRLQAKANLITGACVGVNLPVPPALLAAIASRESHAGLLLDDKGYGDGGHAFGWCQVDVRFHPVHGGMMPDDGFHFLQAVGILRRSFQVIREKFPSWSKAQVWRGAVVAYNAGTKNVQTLEWMDKGTTHDDYSGDVWARALALAGGVS